MHPRHVQMSSAPKLSAAQVSFVERLLAALTHRYSEPASPRA